MHVPVEEAGGIRAAQRRIPGWLIAVAASVIAVAVWYLLSFSSTPYRGSYPRPDAAVEAPEGVAE